MDSLRTRLNILQAEPFIPPAPSLAPRATLTRALEKRLSKAYHEQLDVHTPSSEDDTPGLNELALCIEFEKTVEDQGLWQSSFGNGRALESTDEGQPENRQKGKDVLLIWPEVNGEEVSPSLVSTTPQNHGFGLTLGFGITGGCRFG